jgi:GNAT superfamily N-acetyltransferase
MFGDTSRVELVRVEGGAEARRNGEVVGRLVGELRNEEVRGRHVWSGLGDHSAAEPELYRDLYDVAGPWWLEQGAVGHYVVVPADEPALWAWLGLSFAIEQVHAERRLDDLKRKPRAPQGFTIRQGGPDDLDAAARIAPVITEHQIEGPVWSGLRRPTDEQFRENMREALDDAEATWFQAEREGEPLGGLLLWAEPGEPIALDVAAVLPEARGLGVGVALTQHALWWARRQGHDRITTDWRIANLLASRFWPKRGFRPTAYRMVRYLRH